MCWFAVGSNAYTKFIDIRMNEGYVPSTGSCSHMVTSFRALLSFSLLHSFTLVCYSFWSSEAYSVQMIRTHNLFLYFCSFFLLFLLWVQQWKRSYTNTLHYSTFGCKAKTREERIILPFATHNTYTALVIKIQTLKELKSIAIHLHTEPKITCHSREMVLCVRPFWRRRRRRRCRSSAAHEPFEQCARS